MADLLEKNFPDQAQPSEPTIYRYLHEWGMTRKKALRSASQRDPDLVDLHNLDLAQYSAEQLVVTDESGSNKHDGFRPFAWAPRGKSATQRTRLQRGQRYQVLPAYTQDGIISYRIFRGSTDSTVFKDFIVQLLTQMNPFPRERSVLLLHNAPIHHAADIRKMCEDAGVVLIFLPPYMPLYMPLELLFGRLKRFVKKHAPDYYDSQYHDYGAFLEWCVDRVGADKEAARNDFRHAGIAIDIP